MTIAVLPPAAEAGREPSRLAHLPLPLFSAPMGVGGLGLAWREAARVLGAPGFVGEGLLVLTALGWIVLLGLHAMRAVRHPGALAADLRHPVRAAFAGAVTIGLMILSGGLTPYAPGPAGIVWVVAVVLHLGIATWTVRGLVLAPREPAALTPPLLIPLVGNVLAPVFGARLGFETASWLLFGVGALLWAMIQPLLLGRIVTGPPLPEPLRPTLAILLAPPTVGSVALAGLTGTFGPAALAALGLAIFLALVLASLAPAFVRVPFGISWWAWTFPSAALAIALLRFAEAHPAPWQTPILWLALTAASLILAIVLGATLRAAARGRLLVPEA